MKCNFFVEENTQNQQTAIKDFNALTVEQFFFATINITS